MEYDHNFVRIREFRSLFWADDEVPGCWERNEHKWERSIYYDGGSNLQKIINFSGLREHMAIFAERTYFWVGLVQIE